MKFNPIEIPRIISAILSIARGDNGGCNAGTSNGPYTLNLIAGGNAAFFYVDKLNQNPNSPAGSSQDHLIQSPTEGYQYVGTPGGPLSVELKADSSSYAEFSATQTGEYIFSNQVLYFGFGLEGFYSPVPSTFSFIASATSNGNVYTAPSQTCTVGSNGYITCSVSKNAFSTGFDVSKVTSVTFTFEPSCVVSAQQFCAGQNVPEGDVEYFCNVDGSGFYECLSGAYAALSAEQPCGAGTSCSCGYGVECSQGGTVSPCT